MKISTFKAIVTYDGLCFSGWQIQTGIKSVQLEIENVLKQIFGLAVGIKASGRTDASVHGLAQVFSFSVQTKMVPSQILPAMNALLDKSIRIKHISRVDQNFHPRFSAQKKIYRYLICNFPSPFLKDRAWYVTEKLNLYQMRKACSFIIGTHDFTSFQASGSQIKNTVRTIESIRIKKEYFCIDPDVDVIVIEICGNGFLYKMARNIVGTLVDVGKGKKMPVDVKDIIEARNRKAASATAPAYGLYLANVIYE
ncbi:MAG TPA: tRNA pseudouridine(38-40) synthase TruA [bacterium]|nr:tRNA pseudouridine(38-40) synthase TruA [bacterium]